MHKLCTQVQSTACGAFIVVLLRKSQTIFKQNNNFDHVLEGNIKQVSIYILRTNNPKYFERQSIRM